MKAKKPDNARKLVVTLYPTWFRWKFSVKSALLCLVRLYIPHGSDESGQEYPVLNLSLNFISHMVQMKVTINGMDAPTFQLYIPHGSDESRLLIGDCTKKESLYIPHGSDESDKRKEKKRKS